METGYKVCDAMTKKPITISPDMTIQECAKIMAEKHVGMLLIKKNEELLGVITEQDIVRKSVIENDKPSVRKASEVMESNLHTIEPGMDVYEALMSMRDKNIRHLPVMSNSEMVGLLTLKDILKIQPQLFDLLVEKFELREEENKAINKPEESGGLCQVCGNYSENLADKEGSLACYDCRQ